MGSSVPIKIAIVILNWNGKKHLELFLPSVYEYSTPENATIFIADNGSEDDSVQFIKSKYPEIELIEFDKNYGFAGGYNKALQLIDAQYFVILNSDVEVSENWLKAPLEVLEKEENTAAVAPKIIAYTNKEKFEHAGAAGGYIDKYGYPFCRGRIIDHTEKDNGQYDNEQSVFWATGAALFIKSDIFKENNGFDADFFAHMEEIDLCWRLKNQGYAIKYTPKSTVRHLGGGALPKESPFKVYLNFRNNLSMLYKNLPKNKLFLTLLLRLFLDSFSAIVYLVSLKPKLFWAVIKAHFAFYSMLSILKSKRKNLQTHRIVEDHKEIYQKSIVFDYFLKKKKKFSQLKF
ncbi:MAG: glycosyltransferase family 2 protein [Bacteroidota bacterium]|nr:glycosyltransferase family 2 protein [Bacteroidota bacterium]